MQVFIGVSIGTHTVSSCILSTRHGVLWQLFAKGVGIHRKVRAKAVPLSDQLSIRASVRIHNLDHLAIQVDWHDHLGLT